MRLTILEVQAGITLHGATYHVVRNPDESCAGNKRNPLHWLLYDSDERGNQDPAYGPPIAEDFIQSMQSLLSKHNAVAGKVDEVSIKKITKVPPKTNDRSNVKRRASASVAKAVAAVQGKRRKKNP